MSNARQNLNRTQERVGSTEVQRIRSVIRRLDVRIHFRGGDVILTVAGRSLGSRTP
jgi:hypothetical protein